MALSARARVIGGSVRREGGDIVEDATLLADEVVFLATPVVIHPEDADLCFGRIGQWAQQETIVVTASTNTALNTISLAHTP